MNKGLRKPLSGSILLMIVVHIYCYEFCVAKIEKEIIFSNRYISVNDRYIHRYNAVPGKLAKVCIRNKFYLLPIKKKPGKQ